MVAGFGGEELKIWKSAIREVLKYPDKENLPGLLGQLLGNFITVLRGQSAKLFSIDERLNCTPVASVSHSKISDLDMQAFAISIASGES
jgi:chemotaxis signal transduction protein